MNSLSALRGKSERDDLVKALADLCERDGITAEAIASARIRSLELGNKSWEAMHKNADGDAVITALSGSGSKIVLSPGWETGPVWPPVQPATPAKIVPSKRPPKPATGDRTVLLVPDVHIAHVRDDDGGAPRPAWDLSYDEAVRRLATVVQPDEIVQLGDLLDLAEMGRFDLWPAWSRTTQVDIQAAYEWWARWRADFPAAKMVWIEGNHEQRLKKHLVRANSAALHLHPATPEAMPKDWPVHSVPSYCRLDELGVEWVPGYPSQRFWVAPDLALIHGTKDPGLKDLGLHHSVIMGHWHRIIQRWMTRNDRHGGHLAAQICVGTASPVDGTTPSGHSGLDEFGRPVSDHGVDPWQQGVGVVTVHGDGAWQFEQAYVERGVCRFRGMVI
jgi:hypothetical protein